MDNNDDDWLYGNKEGEGEGDVETEDVEQQEEKLKDDLEVVPVKNGNIEKSAFDTFDEHNFEVSAR
jgi:hypothetical protein